MGPAAAKRAPRYNHAATEELVLIIDFHTHAFPDAVAGGALQILAQRAGIAPVYDGTVQGLRGAMRRSGVTLSVVQPVASKVSQVRAINDWAAEISHDEVIAFGSVHPDFTDLDAELGRLVGLGLRGIKLHPEYQEFFPDDERMDAVYAAAAKWHLIVLFHAGEDVGLPTVRSTPAAFASVLDRFPDLTVVLAHMGGWRQWDEVVRLLAGRDVYLETSFTPSYLDGPKLCRLVEAHGYEKVLFGSDGPWADAAAEVERLRGLGLPGDALEAILWRNAARLLKLPAQAQTP